MSIVISLQRHILNNEKSITELLREALVIASKLQLNDFKRWINNELKGYTDDTIPNYRIVKTSLMFHDPYQGLLPATISDKKFRELFDTKPIAQSIAELEDIITNHSTDSSIEFPLQGSTVSELMSIFKTDCMPKLFTNITQVVGIIEQVKTALLDWSIKLEEDGIIGDENMSFTNEEKYKAQQNIHIENFNGVMGDIDNLGNISTGNKNHNISTINTLESKIDILIKKIESLSIADKNEIVQEIQSNRKDKKKLTNILGQIMTRGSEVATIAPYIGEILGLLG